MIARNDFCNLCRVAIETSIKKEIAICSVCEEDSTGVTSPRLKSPSVELPFPLSNLWQVLSWQATVNQWPIPYPTNRESRECRDILSGKSGSLCTSVFARLGLHGNTRQLWCVLCHKKVITNFLTDSLIKGKYEMIMHHMHQYEMIMHH